jgi:hypothetical protein
MTHSIWEFILKCMHCEIKMFHRDYHRQARLRTEDAHVSLHLAAKLALLVHLHLPQTPGTLMELTEPTEDLSPARQMPA